MKVGIYARVSTRDKQEIENQLSQLRQYCERNGYEVFGEYIDTESESNPDRTRFRAMFSEAYQKKFDTVLFWALDRFSREGARDTINYLSQLESYGVNFISYTEPYLNSIGVFKEAIISILATLAKQEKIRIQERVRAGLERAKAKGAKLGKKSLAPIERKKIIEAHLANKSLSVRQLAKALKMKPGSVHKTLSLFRAGKCDNEGFLTDDSLCSL
jgi:DNA invertase Pin-like site-specific DNA recombinase